MRAKRATSFHYILSGQKFIKNAKNDIFRRRRSKSVIRQVNCNRTKLVKNAKTEKFKSDFWVIFKLCDVACWNTLYFEALKHLLCKNHEQMCFLTDNNCKFRNTKTMYEKLSDEQINRYVTLCLKITFTSWVDESLSKMPKIVNLARSFFLDKRFAEMWRRIIFVCIFVTLFQVFVVVRIKVLTWDQTAFLTLLHLFMMSGMPKKYLKHQWFRNHSVRKSQKKVSFNFLRLHYEWTKIHQKCQKWSIWRVFENLKRI